jgi:hypothetical protein
MAGRRWSWVVVPLVAALPLGCVDEIVVATIDAGPAAVDNHPGGMEVPCDRNSDCQPDVEVCDKPHCDAPRGVCKRRPNVCPNEQQITCGCDGITYWNSCLRLQAGVESGTPDECTEGAKTCSSPDANECPKVGASCAQLIQPDVQCTDHILGACWILPPTCPLRPSMETWISCADPKVCEDLCSSIRSGTVHQRNPQRMCPPLGMQPP